MEHNTNGVWQTVTELQVQSVYFCLLFFVLIQCSCSLPRVSGGGGRGQHATSTVDRISNRDSISLIHSLWLQLTICAAVLIFGLAIATYCSINCHGQSVAVMSTKSQKMVKNVIPKSKVISSKVTFCQPKTQRYSV